MAKLFSNNIDYARLVSPQMPKENINQGQAVLKPKNVVEQEKQTTNNKRDLFGRTISMADRNNQFKEIGSTSHLAEYNLSLYNTRNYRDPFGKTIKLADRFKQFAEITSTSGLPEYVLSDKNTGYIERLLGGQRNGGRFVDPTVAISILENAGLFKSVNKQYAVQNVEQGSTTVKKFPFTSLLGREGSTIALRNVLEFQKQKLTIPNTQISKVKAGDRTFIPNILITKIDYNEVSIFNNNLILGVTVIPTLELRKLRTDLITNPNIKIELTNKKTLITNPNIKISTILSLSLEERKRPQVDTRVLIADEFITFPEFRPSETSRINFQIQADSINVIKVEPITKPERRHGTVELGRMLMVEDQFIEVPNLNIRLVEPMDERSQYRNIQPTRLSSILEPEMRHGSTNVNRGGFEPNRYLGGSFDIARNNTYEMRIGLDELLINPILNALYLSAYNPNTSIGTSMGRQDFRQYGANYTFPIQSVEGGDFDDNIIRPLFVGRNGLIYNNIYDSKAPYQTYDPQNSGPLKITGDNATNGSLIYEPSNRSQLNTYSPRSAVTYKDPTQEWQASHGTGLSSIPGDYRALTYAEIAARRTSSDRARKDFTVNTSDDSLEVWRVRLGMPDDGGGDTLYRSGDATSRDFVKVLIGSLQFRSYITSFSDSYAPSWTDVNYVGRPDTLKVYKSSTRTISLGFKVAAFSDKDLKGMYEKMELLVKKGTMASQDGVYAKGPMTTLTVGGWVVNAPILINSLKFDTNPSEYTWDIEHEVPHIVDISLDCTVLGSNGETPTPFLQTGTYISYGA